jgi:hypothetical protein
LFTSTTNLGMSELYRNRYRVSCFNAIQEHNLKLLVHIHYHSFFVVDGKESLVKMKRTVRSVNGIQTDV